MSITVILLAAGYGTRLYPLTKDTPKALLPLSSGVILDAIVAAIRRVPDIAHWILVTNGLFADKFRAWQEERQFSMVILNDGTHSPQERLGAIRDLDIARQQAGPIDDLLVIGTDNLFEWPMRDFVTLARNHQPSASVALWEAPEGASATQFGVVKLDSHSQIIEFAEKSLHPPSRAVALCVYYFPQAVCGRIRQFLNEGQNGDAPGHFIAWLARQEPVYGVMMPGSWYDIGTLETYHEVVQAWQSHQGK